jgi:hypothetical protein
MSLSLRSTRRPSLAPAQLAELREELESDLRRLNLIAGFPEGGTSLLGGRAQVRARLILGALARIKDGTYGRCLSCGEPIPYQRLIAIPEAASCVQCTGGAGRGRLAGA